MQVSTAVRVREECRPQPGVAARPLLRDVSRDVASCTVCTLRQICMPVDIRDAQARALFDRLVTTRIRLRKGDVLFRAGDRFTALFAVRVGSLKTVTLTDDGTEQVSGYHLPGEIVGVEGIGNDVHACQAVALEDTEVCTLPFDRVEQLAHDDASFQRRLYRLLSSAIVRERAVALVVGTMHAEQRLASFLLDLSNRYQARGYSSTEFVLRMTRAEIGSHLGLKLETVSRLFSRFAEERLIVVSGRVLKLLDRVALQRLVAAG
jgi:CRP/FNR family transcriptional regulator, anaerobic regulatory protein